MSTDAPIRIAIVEDDGILLEELSVLLEEADHIEVRGRFPSGEDVLASDVEVDVFLTDLGLPGIRGAELIAAMRERWPDADILAHTVFEDRGTVFDALVAGAKGYVVKGTGGDELLTAIRQLHDGGSPMSPHIARSVISEFAAQRAADDTYTLSGREREILRLIEDGSSYKEVGAALHISPHTVHSHIKNIYEKLQARGKKDALVKARMRGIL